MKTETDEHWDLFVSHASEDKTDFVNDLVSALANLSIKVWYDLDQLKVGDSLSRTIDRGLSKSRFGVIVITKNFLVKRWPDYEYRSLLSRELNGKKVVLPIWHEISVEDVLEYSPYLGDKFALNTATATIEQIAFRILEITNPGMADSLLRYWAFRQAVRNSPVREVRPESLRASEIRHKVLSPALRARIKILYFEVLSYLTESDLENAIEDFKRDLHPQNEIAIWEKILASGLEYYSNGGKLSKKDVYAFLLGLSMGSGMADLKKSNDDYESIEDIWMSNSIAM